MVTPKSSAPRSPSERAASDDDGSASGRAGDARAQLAAQPEPEREPERETRPQAEAEQQADADRLKRRPYCSRCRNHGKIAHVRGHKRRCEFRACQCDGCQLVECRQLVSAAQIKRRRDMKQDEECGRKTEVTPPVLKRRRSEDLATLIAKKLVGSAAPELANPSAQPSLACAFSVSPVVSGSGSGSASDSLACPQLHSPNAGAFRECEPRPGHSMLLAQADYPSQPPTSSAFVHLAKPSAANGSAVHDCQPLLESASLVGRLHPLFHLPASVLAGQLSPSRGHAQQQVDARASCGSLPPAAPLFYPAPGPKQHALHDFRLGGQHAARQPHSAHARDAKTPRATPSSFAAREQLAIVEDVYQTCGRLAIYAWLLTEQFDLRRVRELVASCRPHYEQLVESECGSRPAKHGADQQQAAPTADTCPQRPEASSAPPTDERREQSASVDSARRTSDCTSGDPNLDCSGDFGDASSLDKSGLLASSAAASLVSVSVSPAAERPTLATMSSAHCFPFHTVASLVNNLTSVSAAASRPDALAQLQPPPAADPYKLQRNISPLANHLNHVPLGLHPNFLWHNLASLGTGGASGLAAAAHLMPSFMDHPLGSHAQPHLRSGLGAHKHAQDIHSGILKASSASASSSSTVL